MWLLLQTFFFLVWAIFTGIILLLIEAAITKANKLKLMKSTVKRCKQLYLNGEACLVLQHNSLNELNERDFLYMNEFLWLYYPDTHLCRDEVNRSRIYWKAVKM